MKDKEIYEYEEQTELDEFKGAGMGPLSELDILLAVILFSIIMPMFVILAFLL